jgi:hypothetical protein
MDKKMEETLGTNGNVAYPEFFERNERFQIVKFGQKVAREIQRHQARLWNRE